VTPFENSIEIILIKDMRRAGQFQQIRCKIGFLIKNGD
jgi:hypothetical protein